MTTEQTVKAWKDRSFQATLSEAELSLMPAHPAGALAIQESDLLAADGAITSPYCAIVTISILTYSVYESCVLC